MNEKISIKNLRQDGNRWTWEMVFSGFGETKTEEYRTNKDGDGLFRWTGTEWKQEAGTCQFSLHGTKTAVYSQIKRAF